MAYSHKKSPNVSIAEETQLEVNSNLATLETGDDDDGNFDFLSPAKDVKKETHNNLYQEEILKKSAQQVTLRTLNAIKIVSPIVSTLLENEQSHQNDEHLSMLFKKIVLDISNYAEQTCNAIGIDSKKEKNAWVRNVLERHLAEFVQTSIKENGEYHLEKLQALIPSIVEFSTDCAEKEPFDDLTPTMLIQLANVRAIMPIMNEALNNFDFFRDINKDIEPILILLHKAAAKATNKLADDYAQEKNRAQLYYLLMQEAGKLYASCWKSEARRIQKIMENPTEKVQESLEKYKTMGGFPLANINNEFEIFFNRFTVVSQKLTVATKKNNLATRLKG